jgi:hypothetical protein
MAGLLGAVELRKGAGRGWGGKVHAGDELAARAVARLMTPEGWQAPPVRKSRRRKEQGSSARVVRPCA